MKYLVTGGAGFIGSALTRRLVAEGHEVTIVDDFSRGRPERIPVRVSRIVHGDIRDERVVESALHGQDAVIHLAYLQGTQTFYAEPRLVLDVALRGMLNVLAGCERTGVGELMLVSSSEAYQVAPVVPTPEDVPLTVPDVLNPRYSYGGGKIACEIMALAWQRTGVLDRLQIVRPHNIYGPDMGREHVIPEFCLRMNDLSAAMPAASVLIFPIQGTGAETRSFCFIDDCITQLRLIATGGNARGAEIYHVGTQDEHTIADVAHQIAALYDREIKIIPGSLPQGSPPRRLPDVSKVTALGWECEVPFTSGLAQTVDWYRAHG